MNFSNNQVRKYCGSGTVDNTLAGLMQWRHVRHLESVTSYQKSDSRKLIGIVPNFMPRLEKKLLILTWPSIACFTLYNSVLIALLTPPNNQ